MKTSNKSIFVSSTFRDMQTERDALRDFVLPKVNEFAARYGRAVEIIDLRWGVDTAAVSEEEQNRKVLRTCLDEIERSRPFFLGLIGDRYGWTPPRRYMEAALDAAHFSLEDTNMSVTALEIEYGVLRSKNPPVCLFYFRGSPDYAAMPEKLRLIYQDKSEGSAKLAKLKEEIRARFPHEIKNYSAETSENGLAVSKDWADMVAADIIAKLRDEWGEPTETPPGWKEQERDTQDSFRESRTAHFAGRAATIADMAAFCLGDKATPQLLMMQGEAGSGKSGLLSKAMDEIKDQCLLLPFSCGISSRSSLAENMLRYFIFLLCENLALEDDSDGITKFQDLKDRFTELLFAASAKMRVVAVVDALDQLISSDEARRMLWISGRLPENFRLLCSIIDGPETEAIKQLGGEVRPVPPVNKEDEAAIIHGIVERHHKQIGSAVVEHILQKQTPDGTHAAWNPLYLSLITQDLVMMDRYELETVQKYMEGGESQPEALAKFMRERIDKTPGDPEGAYLAILDRLEKLIGRDFVRGVCGMIAISRSGLRESDMEGVFKELGMDFNPADFSWLRQMMQGHFSQGDMQQWNFSHQSLRRALREKMPEELERLNNVIVAHLRSVMANDSFAVREIMHHLCVAKRPDTAAEVIAAYYDDHHTTLERGLADVYTEHEEGPAFLLKVPNSAENVEATERWRITTTICFFLPLLTGNTHSFRIEMMLAAIAMIEKQEDVKSRQKKAISEGIVADLYTEIGASKDAGEYYRKYLDARVQIYDQAGTVATLWELIVSYYKMGENKHAQGLNDEARIHYLKASELFEQYAILEPSAQNYDSNFHSKTTDDNGSPSFSFFNVSALVRQHLLEDTLEHKLLILESKENSLGEHINTAIASEEVARAYEETEKYKDALKYYKKALVIRNKVSPNHIDTAKTYDSIGDIYCDIEKYEDAVEFYHKSLKIKNTIYNEDDLDIAASYYYIGNALSNNFNSLQYWFVIYQNG